MMTGGGGVNSALYLLAGLGGAVAASLAGVAPAQAAQSFACTFNMVCVAGRDCVVLDAVTATLTGDGDEWVLTSGDGKSARFRPLEAAPEGTLRLITTELDPDAAAAAMLSISDTGRAFLSTQGNFPDLGAVTHLGTCLSEDG